MSERTKRFEEWISAHPFAFSVETWDAAWSARDSEVERLREALKKCIVKIDSEICTHEETSRGGAIWTICRGCGMKWADDRGGFKPYQEPAWLTEARSLSSQDKESA